MKRRAEAAWNQALAENLSGWTGTALASGMAGK
jgi:hypothetical protein